MEGIHQHFKKLEEIPHQDAQLLMTAVASLPPGKKRPCLATIRGSLLLSLLVARTPKLCVLTMGSSYDVLEELIEWTRIDGMAFGNGWIQPCKYLRELDQGDTHGCRLADMMALLQLPMLDKFKAQHCVGTQEKLYQAERAEEQKIHISDLTLRASYMDLPFLVDILSKAQRLRRFDFEAMLPCDVRDLFSTQQFNLDELCSTIKNCANDLRSYESTFSI